MKKSKISKLSLNKEVITKLNDNQKNMVLGGANNSDRLCGDFTSGPGCYTIRHCVTGACITTGCTPFTTGC